MKKLLGILSLLFLSITAMADCSFLNNTTWSGTIQPQNPGPPVTVTILFRDIQKDSNGGNTIGNIVWKSVWKTKTGTHIYNTTISSPGICYPKDSEGNIDLQINKDGLISNIFIFSNSNELEVVNLMIPGIKEIFANGQLNTGH